MIEDEYGRYLDPAEPVHVTRDGQEIPINQLTDRHLLNILRYHHRVTDEAMSWGPPDRVPAALDPEEVILSGMGHHYYVCESVRRGLQKPCACKCEEGA